MTPIDWKQVTMPGLAPFRTLALWLLLAVAPAWPLRLPAQPATPVAPSPAGATVTPSPVLRVAPPQPLALESSTPTPDVYRRLAGEVEANLKDQVLAKWFPRAVDDQGGGFTQNYNEDWSPGRPGSKAIVYESRLTWTAAQAATRYPEQAAMYQAAARHGLEFLAGKMWDQTNGGFYWSVDDQGRPTGGRAGNDGGSKQEYGNGFAIYAAAAVYQATQDPAALDLAKKGFLWYDNHGHDAVNGGYFELLQADGTLNTNATPAVGGARNGKTMNSGIHMLEALTTLYQVWPDPRVKARLQELYDLLLNKVVADPGYLVQFLSADWKPNVSDDSFGHDVEAGYLLVEAAAALGNPEDARAWTAAKKLVDHALAAGWDVERGGVYNSGGINGGNYAPSREWWVEAEMLNALLLMHEHFGRDNPQYWKAFTAQWDWIQHHGVDPVNGGWWPHVNNDGTPGHGPKSDAWTECYHQGRALMNVADRLRHLAEAGGGK
jgi:mannobiose 2-epimerase